MACRQGAEGSDAELVRASLGGDRDAFALLVTRHWATAEALAARVLGSADQGRDAAQEAVIAAMTSLAQLRSPDRFGAWFCGITLNVARRWLRRSRAERVSGSPVWASCEPDPAELAELSELAAAVRAAVAQLANGQREAVLLFYLQGLTHREVAAELGISVGAVKARLHQARGALTPTLTPFVTTPEETVMTATAHAPAWADVIVAEIRRNDDADPARQVHVMVLSERDGPRQLPIWIGASEATALALSLESQETPRPLTFQMAGRLLEASGSRVAEVRVTRLTDQVFYAAIIVEGPAGRREVDARPSDAVNLALVTGAPIRADNALLDDPGADGRPEWRGYPAATTEIARQATEQIQQLRHRSCPLAQQITGRYIHRCTRAGDRRGPRAGHTPRSRGQAPPAWPRCHRRAARRGPGRSLPARQAIRPPWRSRPSSSRRRPWPREGLGSRLRSPHLGCHRSCRGVARQSVLAGRAGTSGSPPAPGGVPGRAGSRHWVVPTAGRAGRHPDLRTSSLSSDGSCRAPPDRSPARRPGRRMTWDHSPGLSTCHSSGQPKRRLIERASDSYPSASSRNSPALDRFPSGHALASALRAARLDAPRGIVTVTICVSKISEVGRGRAHDAYPVTVPEGSGEAALVEIDDIARLAEALAGVRRTAPGGLAQWRYHGRLIARQLDGAHVVIRADFDVRDSLLRQFPDTFSVPARYMKHMMVVANLATANAGAVEDALEAAWRLQRSAD